MSAARPTPIMEVLLSDNASSDSFYASKAYDNALAGARTARTQNGVVAAVRKAESIALHDLPYVPLVHLNAVEIAPQEHLARLEPSPSPKGRPLFETSEQLLALKPGPAPVADAAAPVASTSTDDGWLTTPRSVLIGAVLIALAILGSRFIAAGRRRTEPLEWTEE